MAYCQIPLTCQPYSDQNFKVTLDSGKRNVNIRLKLRYHDLYNLWTATIIDNATGVMLVDMLPLVCGVNLLGQYRHLEIGEAYIMPVTDTDLMMPDNETLGSTFVLVWGDAT